MSQKGFFTFIIFALSIVSCTQPQETSSGRTKIQIHDIQGCTHYSPLTGKEIRDIEGIVTARSDNGFYLQDDRPDELNCSSEAIFVYTETYPNVKPGDRLRIEGRVEEFIPGGIGTNNLPVTELVLSKQILLSSNNKLPDPVEIGGSGRKIPDHFIDSDGMTIFNPDRDGIDFYESLESMLVTFSAGQVVRARDDYNEVVLLPTEFTSNILLSPEGALMQQEDNMNPERVILNLSKVNSKPINVGSSLDQPVTGILDYDHGNFKIDTFGEINFSQRNISFPSIENRQANVLSLVSLNVENLSLDDGKVRFSEFADMIANHLNTPDIVVLHEIMDNSGSLDDGTVTATEIIELLIDKIKTTSGITYDYVQIDPKDNEDGGVPGGNIRSVVLFRTDRNLSLSSSNLLPSNPSRIGSDSSVFKNTRKPLVVNFQLNNLQIVVIATHLTSRSADSPLYGQLQPISEPEKEKRANEARIVNQFVQDLIRKAPDALVVVAGDMNDYPWSDTLRELRGDNELLDLGELLPKNERYSYVYEGNAFQFDYILVSQPFPSNGFRFYIPHINSLLDKALQISDHDPVLMEMRLP
jgi:predicted extracellular nuclease